MPMDARDLNLLIDYPDEAYGWIHCYLTFDAATHPFLASQVMPPFQNLLNFLRALTLQRLPAQFFWDEEGKGPYFEAWPLAGESPASGCLDFHLRVIHVTNSFHPIGEGEEQRTLIDTYHTLCVDADLNREAVVDVFLAALRDFALYSPHPEEWGITLADLQAFERLRQRPIPARWQIDQAGTVDLLITRQQDDEDQTGGQSMQLSMWEMCYQFGYLDDSDAFWPHWIALLEHALDGKPYEFSILNMIVHRLNRDMVAQGIFSLEEVGPDYSTRLAAAPLDHPRHFRLQIFETDHRYTDYLCFDEVIDRFQLVEVFLREFDALLRADYRPYPDEDGQTFDLRQLPTQRLRETLPPDRQA